MVGNKFTYPNGHQEWRDQYGRLHRENGPARIWNDGMSDWWISGIHQTFETYCIQLCLASEDIMILKLKYNV